MTMKNLLIALLIFTTSFTQLFAANITVTPSISDVTVYLEGATINSSVKTKIPTGVSYITLTNLPTMVQEESIQVAGLGDFTILHVAFKLSNETTKIVDSLTKVQQTLTDKKTTLTYTKDVYNQEIDVLNANKEIKGTNSTLSTTELDKVLTYYQTEMLSLKSKIYETEKQITETTTALNQVNRELATYKRAQQKGEVIVAVSSAKEQTISLGLSYYVSNASWTPFYEVRVAEVNKDLEVAYKAKVVQTTGYNWENVNVTLSTGNPTLNGTVPTLDKWILREQQMYYANTSHRMKAMTMAVEANDLDEDAVAVSAAKASGISTTTNTKMTSIEFAIHEKFSVKSSQNDATLTINKHSLPAEYVYQTVPKLDKHAYLIAKVSNFEKYNFLSGEATLYLEGKYVGTSTISIAQTTDTINLSLGQDAGIVIDRTLSDEYNKKASVGKNYKQTVTWTISAKNNKSNPVTLEIIDNIPVSGNSNITVSNTSYEGATINDKNILTWKYQLNAAESKTAKLSYTVTYPKTMSLNLK